MIAQIVENNLKDFILVEREGERSTEPVDRTNRSTLKIIYSDQNCAGRRKL